LAEEGFIHLSTADQWLEVANRLYSGIPDLLLLAIDEAEAGALVRYERLDGALYPHLYGVLIVGWVREVHELPMDSHGVFGVPSSLGNG